MIKRKNLREHKVQYKKIFRLILKAILIISGSYLVISSFLKIDLLKINYLYIHTDKKFESAGLSKLAKGDIIRLNTNNIENYIKKENPKIENVLVKKNFFGSLSIFVAFRTPVALALNGILTEEIIQPDASASAEIKYGFERKDESEMYIDKYGFTFPEEESKDLPVIGISSSSSTTLFMLQTIQKLKDVKESIDWITNKDNKVVLLLPEGQFIIMDSNKDAEEQVSSLQLIRNRFRIEGRKFKYLDLRFQKPVVKFLKE